MTRYEHLHPNAIDRIELDAEQRIQWIKTSRWIGYPRAQAIIGEARRLGSLSPGASDAQHATDWQ